MMVTTIIILILIYLIRKNHLQNKEITRLVQEVGMLINELKRCKR